MKTALEIFFDEMLVRNDLSKRCRNDVNVTQMSISAPLFRQIDIVPTNHFSLRYVWNDRSWTSLTLCKDLAGRLKCASMSMTTLALPSIRSDALAQVKARSGKSEHLSADSGRISNSVANWWERHTQRKTICRKDVETMSMSLKCRFQRHYCVYSDIIVVLKSIL